MLKTIYLIFILVLLPFHVMMSQSIEIQGIVESEKDIENIHVINKTAKIFRVTNSKGEFKVYASLNDTLVFTSIQHKTLSLVVDEKVMSSKTCLIKLEEQINELDEVTIGKILTGDLNSDISNTEGDPPINFYDVGIPGYTGKISTQSERRLSEASNFRPTLNGNSMGAGGSVSILPIINAITGRTKMLKERVELENKADLLHKIKADLSKDFFSVYELEKTLRTDFFFFCEEDSNFYLRCKNKGDIEIFEFLKEKLIQYKQNLNSTKD